MGRINWEACLYLEGFGSQPCQSQSITSLGKMCYLRIWIRSRSRIRTTGNMVAQQYSEAYFMTGLWVWTLPDALGMFTWWAKFSRNCDLKKSWGWTRGFLSCELFQGFWTWVFLKYFPNLNPKKSRGSNMKLEFDLMKLECHRRVNKDNFEIWVSILAFMDEFCEWVSLQFATFHLGSP